MFASAQLKFLREQKQELLVQSEVQRRFLAQECGEVQRRLEWFDRTLTTVRRILPWCGLALPLWRFCFSRRKSAGDSWLRKILTAAPIARQLAQAWRSLSNQTNT